MAEEMKASKSIEHEELPIKSKLTKQDAQTIAQGQQISAAIDKKRLRSSSGKIYHAEINLPEGHTATNSMATIEEIVSSGGFEHAEENHDKHEENVNTNMQLVQMIQNLQTSVESMNGTLTSVADGQQKVEKRMDSLVKSQTENNTNVNSLDEKVNQLQVKVDILADIVVRQQHEINSLKSQVLDTQIRSMKNNITITGIPERENENCIQAVNDFFVNKLGIQDKLIPIEQAYRMGYGNKRAMLVSLRHTNDKTAIFQKVGNLKGQKQDGIQCFVSSQLPEEANEKRRNISAAMFENKKKPASQRMPLSVKQGTLMFNNKPIEQKVQPPTPGQLLRLSDSDLEQLEGIKMAKGLHEEQDENMFVAYATSVTNHSEINQAYKKMRLMHGEATHVACAYKLRSVKAPYNQGGADDGEHGATRNMLQVLQDGDLNNIAVFMVRYFSGVKLGPRRFKLIKTVMSAAITAWQVSQQDNTGWGDEELNETESDTS